jgi:hypothetical protein
VQIKDLTKVRIQSKWAVFAAPIVIGTVATYNWIVAPQVTYLRAVQKYEPVIARMAQEKTDLQGQVRGRKRELVNLKDQLNLLRPTLYTPDQAQQLWGDLETMAVQQGCTVINVQLGSSRPLPAGEQEQGSLRVEWVSAAVTVTGDYGGIVAFIGDLQAQTRKIWVSALMIEPTERDARRLQCRIAISINVIYEKEAVPHD